MKRALLFAVMAILVSPGSALAAGQSPRATFTVSPAAPSTGQQVTFDASDSTCWAPGGWSASNCLSFSWVDDADAADPLDDPQYPLGTGSSMLFTFRNPGTKYVWLTVTDAAGRSTQTMTPVVLTAAPTPTPTPTPTPSPTPTPTPTPPPTPTGDQFPNPSTTGVPVGWAPVLTFNGTYTVSTPGAVVEDIQVNGDLHVTAPNVTLRRVRVVGGSIDNRPGNTCFNGMVVEDSEILPGSTPDTTDYPSFETGGYTARRVKIWNRGEGFRVGGKSSGGCGPVDIEDSFVKILANGDCQALHNDGIQGYDGPALTVRNTTIDYNREGPCAYAGTGAFFYPDQGNTRADLNHVLLMGGGYTLRLMTPGSVTDTKLLNHAWDYGPMDVTCNQVQWGVGNETVEIDSDYQVTAHDGPLACS